jgi:hypothetical protein
MVALCFLSGKNSSSRQPFAIHVTWPLNVLLTTISRTCTWKATLSIMSSTAVLRLYIFTFSVAKWPLKAPEAYTSVFFKRVPGFVSQTSLSMRPWVVLSTINSIRFKYDSTEVSCFISKILSCRINNHQFPHFRQNSVLSFPYL